MLRKSVTTSFILISFAAAALAQSKPDFSGTWKLNTSKSDFGVLPGPDSRTDVIEHSEPKVKIATTQDSAQGKMQASITYTTDGKEAANKVGPRDITSTSGWEGNSLVINSKLKLNENDVTIKATWTLSDDGKTLTQNVHLASQMGETDQKLIFEKQPSGAVPAQAPMTPREIGQPPSAGGPKPNFSGIWKLNTAKSDFSVLPGPDMRTDTIEHSDPTIKLARKENGPEGQRDYVLNISTDGKEVVNSVGPGVDIKITGTWEGAALVTIMKLKFQEQDVTIKRVSTLSDDGKTMLANSHITSAMGELDQKEVYDKQ